MDCSTPGFPVLHYLPEFVCSDSCPVSPWCYLTISSSATPFSFCLQFLQASGSFPISQLISPDGQSAYIYIYIYYWFCCLKNPCPIHLSNIPCSLETWLFILFTECNILQFLIRSFFFYIALLKTSKLLLNFSTCITITEREALKFELYVWSFLPPHTQFIIFSFLYL